MSAANEGAKRSTIAFLSSGAREANEALESLVARYGNCAPEKADVIVALGGDGLMLQTLHRTMTAPKPIYGMNRGSVGFLMNEFSDQRLAERLAAARASVIHPLVMRTRDIHRSGEGRHMTSHRQLFSIDGGGMIIDTPGLRETQLWEGAGALGNVFEDVERLAASCRFADCAHSSEPGCAVVAAVADLTLPERRLHSWRKLVAQSQWMAQRSDARARSEQRRQWAAISKSLRRHGLNRP